MRKGQLLHPGHLLQGAGVCLIYVMFLQLLLAFALSFFALSFTVTMVMVMVVMMMMFIMMAAAFTVLKLSMGILAPVTVILWLGLWG